MLPKGAISSLEELTALTQRADVEVINIYWVSLDFKIRSAQLLPDPVGYDHHSDPTVICRRNESPDEDMKGRPKIELCATFPYPKPRETHPHCFALFTNYFWAHAHAQKTRQILGRK